MELETIGAKFEPMRVQVGHQRKGNPATATDRDPTASADALLQRMLDKIDGLYRLLPKKRRAAAGLRAQNCDGHSNPPSFGRG
jgi:hypothetical protein